jgi:DNA-binding Xre family transcriptional regulator
MAQLQFRLRELMAERERKTGESVTYAVIQKETGTSPNTLSTISQGKIKMVGISVIERLLDYFECEVADLLVYE